MTGIWEHGNELP